MREMTKNRKLTIITSIVIILALILSLTCGLFTFSPKDDGTNSASIVADANVNIGANTGNDSDKGKYYNSNGSIKYGWYKITTATELLNFLEGKATDSYYTGPYTNGFLANDLLEKNGQGWVRAACSNITFTGTLDGCGYTIELTDANDPDSWPSANQAQSEINNYVKATGFFVAINKGTIKNVKFKYSNKSVVYKTDSTDIIWSIGLVCGENAGNIHNVRLDVDKASIKFHYNYRSADGWGQKIILGGICGIQNGVLGNVYVNMTGSTNFECDSKNNKTGGWGGASASLHVSIVGGVYGVFKDNSVSNTINASINDKTYNLAMTGESGVSINAYSSTTGSGSNVGVKAINLPGAVAGHSVQGVKGVVWDFKGILVTHRRQYDGSNYLTSDGSNMENSRVAACGGIPNGYYSPSTEYVNMNGADWLKVLNPNFFSSLRAEVWTEVANADNSDGARGKFDKNKVDLTGYDENVFGSVNMQFTNNPGILNINKNIYDKTQEPDYYTRLFWFVGGRGELNGIDDGTNQTIVDYSMEYNPDQPTANSNKNFALNLNLNSEFKVTISTGYVYSGLASINAPTYNGFNYWDLYSSQAFKNLSMHSASIEFNKNKVKFMVYNYNDRNNPDAEGTEIGDLIFPRDVTNNEDINANRKIVRVEANANPNYSYVDDDNRFCVRRTDLYDVRVKPIDIAASGVLQYSNKPASSVQVKVKSEGAITNSIDSVKFRMVGTENYTQSAMNYTLNDGGTFTITDTTPFGGQRFELLLYKGSTVVSKTTGNTFGPLQIDGVKPFVKDTSVFEKITTKDQWIKNSAKIKFSVRDENSGVMIVAIKKQPFDDYTGELDGTQQTTYLLDKSSGGLTNLENEFEYEFNDYAKYTIIITDEAGNVNDEFTFNANIDTVALRITGISYRFKDGSSYNWVAEGVQKTVFADVTCDLGPSGGHLNFASNDANDDTSTAGNVYDYKNHMFTAEIKLTKDGGTTYKFTLYTNAKNDDGTDVTPVIQIDGTTIFVTQLTIHIGIDGINMPKIGGEKALTKIYDKTSDFPAEYVNQIGLRDTLFDEFDEDTLLKLSELGMNSVDDLFNNVDISAKFYTSSYPTKIEEAVNASEDVKLVVELRAKEGNNFAIVNSQLSNNYYVFMANDPDHDYCIAGEITKLDKVAILKRQITDLKVNYSEKTYYQDNKPFSSTVSYAGTNNIPANTGLVEGDTIDDLKLKYHTIADKYSNVDDYSVYAEIPADCMNYRFADGMDKYSTEGILRVKRYAINKISIEGELNTITCYQMPEIKAYFWNAQGKKEYLDVIYKNDHKEEIDFIEGKRTEIGKYFYVFLLSEELYQNYANLCDSNMLIGSFYVVGDMVEEGKSYIIKDLDKTTSDIEVEFTNKIINFRSLIEFKEQELSSKLKIYYGPAELEDSFIQDLGVYLVTIKVLAGDNRYAPIAIEYNVRVVPATIKYSTNDDLIGIEKTYDNKDIQFTTDNIKPNLFAKLTALGITENDFKYTYTRNNVVYDSPSRVKAVGDYIVKLVISNKNINDVTLISTVKITPLDLEVIFDIEKYSNDDRITVSQNEKGEYVISKDFSGSDESNKINVSVTEDFKTTLRGLGVNSSNFGFTSNNGIGGISNDFINAGDYSTRFTIGNNGNINLVNSTINVVIRQFTLSLSINDFRKTYDGADYIVKLSDADIEILAQYNILPEAIVFDVIKGSGYETIDGGLKFTDAGEYEISITMSRDPNVKLGNGTVKVIIDKIKANDITIVTEQRVNGKLTEVPIQNGYFEKEYDGEIVELKVSSEDKAKLISYGVTEGQMQFSDNHFQDVNLDRLNKPVAYNNITFQIVGNKNIDSQSMTFSINIKQKKLGEYQGVFDANKWLCNGEDPTTLPGSEENSTKFDDGMIFGFSDADRTQKFVYSIKLEDEAELIKEGFVIVYKYNGVICDGVTDAGAHTVTAEISRANDNENRNYEFKVVQLWKRNSKGEFVIDSKVPDKDLSDVINPPDPNETGKDKVDNRIVESFTIEKAELQVYMADYGYEKFGKDYEKVIQLANVQANYDAKPHGTGFTAEQLKIFAEMGVKPIFTTKTEFVKANEHSVGVQFKKIDEYGNTDNNYDTAEMEAAVNIMPLQVKIHFEVDDKYKDAKGNIKYGEGDKIEIKAYYFDLEGDKIWIKTTVVEKVTGSGEDIEYSVQNVDPKTKKLLLSPGKFQVTANMHDANYSFNEDDINNYLIFHIKNESATTNMVLYILLAVVLVALVVTGLIILRIVRMFNPAIQDVDLDGVENF